MNRSVRVVDVVFNIATPTGRGAVATIIIDGTDAFDVINCLFRPVCKRPVSSQQIDNILYGNWLIDGEPGEDLVVCPKSEHRVEVHCHGGESAARTIAMSLENIGAIAVDSNAMSSRISNSRYLAEFISSISKAGTRRTARILLAQRKLHGRLWRGIRTALENRDSETVSARIKECRQWASFGSRLVDPWRVVLCGPPNVGKSSLNNALLGFNRSIVHHVAGTTRDTVSDQTAIDGWPVQLFDTAGFRDTPDEIERLGIRGAENVIQAADLAILAVDATRFDRVQMEQLRSVFQAGLVVANKSDLARCDAPEIDVSVSALTGDGLGKMIDLISRRLVPDVPDSDQAIPISHYQTKLLDRVNALAADTLWQSALDIIQDEQLLETGI